MEDDNNQTENTNPDNELETTQRPEITREPTLTQPEPESTHQMAKGGGKAVWVILVILALLLGGGLGYAVGMNNADDSDAEALQQQVNSLQDQLNTAKDNVNDSQLDDKNQEIEELKTENAELEQENEDLRDQLSEQNSSADSSQDTQNTE